WEEKVRAGPRPEAPRIKGLYLHYELTGGKGTQVPDASGLERHGTYKGGKEPQWLGGALKLDGSGAHVDAGNVADFERTAPFSYGCWVQPETKIGCLLSRIDDPQAYRGFDLFLNEGRFEAHFVHSWPADGMKVKTKKSFADSAWHHVMVTYDGSTQTTHPQIYV